MRTISHHRAVIADHDRSWRERGESLIELMATVVLMGTAVIGLISAMFTMTAASDQFHKAARANISVQGYAEALKRTNYIACAQTTTYPSFTTITGDSASLPSGYSANVTQVRYWNGTIDSTTGAMNWNSSAATCDSSYKKSVVAGSVTTVVDNGVQEITVQVQSPNTRFRATETLVLIKRDQRCAVVYLNVDGKPC